MIKVKKIIIKNLKNYFFFLLQVFAFDCGGVGAFFSLLAVPLKVNHHYHHSHQTYHLICFLVPIPMFTDC